jgi:exodeoxyribonuclease VII large subunit
VIRTPLSVTEVTRHISKLFDADGTLPDVWIVGEVQESKVSRSGHIFFTLCEGDCRINAVMFRSRAVRQRLLPSSGGSCVAHGRVSIYPHEGSYRFYVDLIEDAGVGLAALELQLLRLQLESEGLFEESRKRDLPVSPRCIGVVTSPESAVWQDIQTVVRRRNPFALLLLAPAIVQGDDAPWSLCSALQALAEDRRPSVIIVARGGGSSSDLAAFNDETLVRAVFGCPVPVVSAVGHETDWSLLDLVADLRAPTPSAAAELCTVLVITSLRQAEMSFAVAQSRFHREIDTAVLSLNQIVDVICSREPNAVLKRHRESLLNLNRESMKISHANLHSRRAKWLDSKELLSVAVTNGLVRLRRAVDLQTSLLDAISPLQTLKRGYASLSDLSTGQPVVRLSQVSTDQQIRSTLSDGAFLSTVSSTIPK